MLIMEKFFDQWDMICQGPPGRDGGDSCHRMGMYYFGLWVRKQINVVNNNCYRSNLNNFSRAVHGNIMRLDGKIRRHPDPKMWYSEWNRASRDQSIPFVIACGALGLKTTLKQFARDHRKRLFCFSSNTIANWVYKDDPTNYVLKNKWEKIKYFFGWKPKRKDGSNYLVYSTKLPDFTGPEFWALYIRAFNYWFLYPCLLLFDLITLLGSLKRRYDNDHDVNNHIMVCVYGHFKYPTPVMFLANCVNKWDELHKKQISYFTGQHDGVADMLPVWKPIMAYMASQKIKVLSCTAFRD